MSEFGPGPKYDNLDKICPNYPAIFIACSKNNRSIEHNVKELVQFVKVMF
jgi:hypothetical protein